MCLALLGCPRSTPPPPPPPPPDASVPRNPGTITLRDYHIRFPQQGARVWEADVKKTQADPTKGRLAMTGIACVLYDGGHAALRVTADDGTAMLQGSTADVHLHGHVHAIDLDKGITLDAAAFAWNSTNGKIGADSLVWLMQGLRQNAEHGIFSTNLHAATFDHVRTDILRSVSK